MIEYIQEGEKLVVLCDVNGHRDMKIGRFLEGLREALREKLEST